MFWNIQDGHHPKILTERKEHADLLAGLIKDKCDNVFVFSICFTDDADTAGASQIDLSLIEK